jgi:hypothetical protein
MELMPANAGIVLVMIDPLYGLGKAHWDTPEASFVHMTLKFQKKYSVLAGTNV